jgi:hypothetical protein
MQLAHAQFPILNEMATATRMLVIAAVLGVGYRHRGLIALFGMGSCAVLAVPHERSKTKNRNSPDDTPGHTEGTSGALPDVKPKTTVGKLKDPGVQPPENRHVVAYEGYIHKKQPSGVQIPKPSGDVVPPHMTPEEEAALRDLGKSIAKQFKWLSPSSSSG